MVKFIDDKSLVDINRAMDRIEVGGTVYSGTLHLYALSTTRVDKAKQSQLVQHFVEQEDAFTHAGPLYSRQSSAPPRFETSESAAASARAAAASSAAAAAAAATARSKMAPPPAPKRAASDPPSMPPPAKRKRADSEATVRTTTSTLGGLPSARILAIKRHVTCIMVLNEQTRNEDFDFSDTPLSSFEERSVAHAFNEAKAFLERVLLVEGRQNLVDIIFAALRTAINVWNGKQTTCCRYLAEGDDNPMAPPNVESLVLFFYNPTEQYKRVCLLHLTCRPADDFDDEADDTQRSYDYPRVLTPDRGTVSPSNLSGARSTTPGTGDPDDDMYDVGQERSDKDDDDDEAA